MQNHRQAMVERLGLLERLVETVVRDGESPTRVASSERPKEEVDVVISGGGLRGYFVTGASAVFRERFEQANIDIKRYAGTSAGAWCAAFITMGMSTTHWCQTYTKTREYCMKYPEKKIHQAYREVVIPWFYKEAIIPEDAYARCSRRCFISITRLTPLPQNEIVSEFKSNEDLLECLLASSAIPYFTEPTLTGWFRGERAIDGGISNNLPLFLDNPNRYQLILRLSDIPITWTNLVSPGDDCIESMVLRGALMFHRFWRSSDKRKKESHQDDIGPFYWYKSGADKTESDDDNFNEDSGFMRSSVSISKLGLNHGVRVLLTTSWLVIFSFCTCVRRLLFMMKNTK